MLSWLSIERWINGFKLSSYLTRKYRSFKNVSTWSICTILQLHPDLIWPWLLTMNIYTWTDMKLLIWKLVTVIQCRLYDCGGKFWRSSTWCIFDQRIPIYLVHSYTPLRIFSFFISLKRRPNISLKFCLIIIIYLTFNPLLNILCCSLCYITLQKFVFIYFKFLAYLLELVSTATDSGSSVTFTLRGFLYGCPGVTFEI